MKKIYITPNTLCIRINPTTVISGSLDQLGINTDSEQSVSKSDVWVKENRSDVNVWSDDWSK